MQLSRSPQRLADGSVFLPKQTQRQLTLRTLLSERGEQPISVELSGKVVIDPGSGGRVQTMIGGRIEAPAGGIAPLGKPVKKGELLARVHPAVSPLELGGQTAQAAELRAALGVAEKRLVRLRELEATVARKDLDVAEAEVQSLRERVAAIGRSLRHHDELRAPVSGIVAAANVVAGQIVEPRDVLFEIIDPANLRVEALAYEPRLAADIAGAYGSAGPGQEVLLSFVGAGRSLREQAAPGRLLGPGCTGKPLACPKERWLSGRRHRTRNAACSKGYRGFESLPLRKNNEDDTQCR